MSEIKVKYLGDLRTESTHMSSGHKITTDAPVDNAGLGRKFSPTDLLASSLGSCLLTIMSIVAKRHSINMLDSRAEIIKTMLESPRRISKLDVSIFMPKKIDKEKMNILKIAAELCPVHASLSKDLEINIKFS